MKNYVTSLFEQLKQKRDQGNEGIFNLNLLDPAEKLQLAIYEQRYFNISTFIEKREQKKEVEERLSEQEKEFLTQYYFFDNYLKEMNFIGFSFYMDANFLKQRVPYLYRCVGKDNVGENNPEEMKIKEHVSEIMNKSKEQIEMGTQGELFSYSKCFGRMLYKYASIRSKWDSVTIEVRTNTWVNVVKGEKEEHPLLMIQEYLMQNLDQEGERILPYFSVDISNARNNEVKNVESWIESYLGEQKWTNWKRLVNPIADAEVVNNFTNNTQILNENVKREKFNLDEFCILLYQYFKLYYEKVCKGDLKVFNDFITKSIETIPAEYLKKYFESILVQAKENEYENYLNDNLDWELEKKYLTLDNEISIYKESNSEWKTLIWKEILFKAVQDKYTYVDYGKTDEENEI